jgi:hypothetical protein
MESGFVLGVVRGVVLELATARSVVCEERALRLTELSNARIYS